MKQQQLREVIERTALERVRFKDGMVVNADDLHDAMTYPVDVLRTLVRAYFGCGVVCGLEVERPGESGFKVTITKGMALDCHGYPLELGCSVSLDLTPDKCAGSDTVYIAIRRVTSDELPRPQSRCSEEMREPEYQCTRVQEHLQIKVFAKKNLPRTICMHAEAEDVEEEERDVACGTAEGVPESTEATQEGLDPCACLKACEDAICCDDAWVLLACVARNEEGISEQGIDTTLRKYVKPIDCFCRPDYSMPSHWREEVQRMIKEAMELEQQVR